MKLLGKALAYVLLILAAAFCFTRMRSAYVDVDVRGRQLARVEGEETGAKGEPVEAARAATTPPAGTNVPPSPVDPAVTAGETNAVASTNGLAKPVAGGAVGAAPAAAGQSRAADAGLYLAGFVLSLLALAVLGGWDLTQAVAGRATRAVGADLEAAPENDPEYDAAEAEWAKGNFLEAIGQMRDYLKRNPSEQYAAIRIAEIYEKDLHNYLAAALELEEVLAKKLPREKWGWTAVHLSNLYSGRLNQPDKALAVLHRIVSEYPDTAAAQKARQRLGLPEPDAEAAAAVEAVEAAEEPPPEDSSLPQGFRAKKR